jgi:hypothetical protein
MTARNEHDDDLEPEVIEGAEFEIEKYEEEEDDAQPPSEDDEESPDDEAGDTI